MNHADASAVRLRVILEVDEPSQRRAFVTWAESSGVDVAALENEGCGCCVDIYTFSSAPASALALEDQLRAVGAGVEYLTDRA
ncbi:hypothetical protein GCM10025871_38830 [Deinococcus metallilatus]|nr:hypothetical protein GCM10025871_38830 [Deinococcus metallilatus]